MEEKALYEMILEKLGVEEGEKFIIRLGDENLYNPYHFSEGYLIDNDDDFDEGLFVNLLTGEATIEKLPWKPFNGDVVWYVNYYGYVCKSTFSYQHPSHLSKLKCGWIFKSYEESEANKDRVLAEMKEVLG